MKVVLVIATGVDFSRDVRAALSPEHYRLVERANLEAAEPVLTHALADACVLHLDNGGGTGLRSIGWLRQLARQLPLVVVLEGPRDPATELMAYRAGAHHVLTQPIPAGPLEIILERLLANAAGPTPAVHPGGARLVEAVAPIPPEPPSEPARAAALLESLGRLSTLLNHSLRTDAALTEVLLFIREVIGINRAAIFLRGGMIETDAPEAGAATFSLKPVSGLGMPWELLKDVELNLEAGLGGRVRELGRILRRDGPEAAEPEIQREFQMLGAQVAIPIQDRERLLGVATFDTRLTGEPLSRNELTLIFHILEQVGLAMKRLRAEVSAARRHALLQAGHEQLRQNRQMGAKLAAEIGNMAQPIVSLVELLSPMAKLPAPCMDMIKLVSASVNRIKRCQFQMICLAREPQELAGSTPCTLERLIEQAGKMALSHRQDFRGSPPELTTTGTSTPLKLRADPEALAFALMEVILNGLQAAPTNPKVAITLSPSAGGKACVGISDNGPGFTSDTLRQAGTPFFTTKGKGIGAGLWVARRILEAHGGQLLLPEASPMGEPAPGFVRILLPTV
jgi:signal transduction histidine kinase/DNA-binding NarL/FixJ family response regulator